MDWLCQGSFSRDKVDEALLSVFSDLDAPTSPSSKVSAHTRKTAKQKKEADFILVSFAQGMAHFIHGLTPEMRESRRARFLDLSGAGASAKLADCAQKHLANAAQPNAFLFLDKNGTAANLSAAVVGASGLEADGLAEGGAWTVRKM